jgi:hypothetical protein
MTLIRRPWFWLICVVASQYIWFQLFTQVQYLDSPRNLQWGIYVWEEPRYLIDAENRYDRTNGFPPTPLSLAPAGLASGTGGTMHSWWRPSYLGLFALAWAATGSFTALELIVPIAAGITVVLTYLFGLRYFSEPIGIVAALLVALQPNYREMAVLTMVEPISALLLLAALWALLTRRAWLTALLGMFAMLGKIDMIALYYGMLAIYLGVGWWYQRRQGGQQASFQFETRWQRYAIMAGIPLLALGPWLYWIYVVLGRFGRAAGGASWEMFALALPLMGDQFFILGRIFALIGLACMLMFAILGMLRPCQMPPVRIMLGLMSMLGIVILIVYASMPGASDNPRIAIPVLPMVMLLVAQGIATARRLLMLYAALVLIPLYLFGNISGGLYQLVESRADRDLKPAWAVLRNSPPGLVLTEHYWEATLYGRQPATWFQHDPEFQHAILHDTAAFKQYLQDAPIRYIVLPQAASDYAALANEPISLLYNQLNYRRAFPFEDQTLVDPSVRAHLEATYAKQTVGRYLIYTVPR